MSISYGLDIATSVSIITAAYFYIKDVRRARDEKKQQFAISRMQRIIDAIGSHRIQFDPIHKGFEHSIGTEKTSYFNNYLSLLRKLQIELLVVKDSDFVMYATNDEIKAIDKIMNYITETFQYTSNAAAKMGSNTITAEDITKLLDLINTYDQNLSKLTITYAELLKHRLSC